MHERGWALLFLLSSRRTNSLFLSLFLSPLHVDHSLLSNTTGSRITKRAANNIDAQVSQKINARASERTSARAFLGPNKRKGKMKRGKDLTINSNGKIPPFFLIAKGTQRKRPEVATTFFRESPEDCKEPGRLRKMRREPPRRRYLASRSIVD